MLRTAGGSRSGGEGEVTDGARLWCVFAFRAPGGATEALWAASECAARALAAHLGFMGFKGVAYEIVTNSSGDDIAWSRLLTVKGRRPTGRSPVLH